MREEVDPSTLHGHWCASYEEGEPNQMVFRPSTYTFPPSRGLRTCFDLKPDGTYAETGAGPDDRRHATQGTWTLGNGNKLILHSGSGEAFSRVMVIVHAGSDRLILTATGSH
jgi:hypothetical protein